MLNLKVLQKKSKQRAFSLIELSIVLIIIGLLIAGITASASLINATGLRTLMSESKQINTDVNNFFVKFDALPGDYDSAIGSSVAGNDDNVISFINGEAASAAEGMNVISHLVSANIIDDVVTPFAYTTTYASTEAMAAIALDNLIPSETSDAGWAFGVLADSSTTNYMVVTNGLSAVTNTLASVSYGLEGAVSPTLTPIDALSIDEKLDDGIANTGKVIGILSASTPVEGTSGCFDSDDGVYVTTFAGKECALAIEIDISSQI